MLDKSACAIFLSDMLQVPGPSSKLPSLRAIAKPKRKERRTKAGATFDSSTTLAATLAAAAGSMPTPRPQTKTVEALVRMEGSVSANLRR